MQAEHTQCNKKNTIFPKQNVSMFSRYTLTEWGQSAKITERLVISCQRIQDRRGAHWPMSYDIESCSSSDLYVM